MLIGRTDGGTASERAHSGRPLVPMRHVSGGQVGARRSVAWLRTACKGGADGVTHGGQNTGKLVAAPTSCGTCELPNDSGCALVLPTPARPNEELVLDALQSKLVKVVAIPIDFPEPHRFAAVVPRMKT